MTDWLTPDERERYADGLCDGTIGPGTGSGLLLDHAAEADRRIAALEADLRFALEQLMYRDECKEHARILLMQKREGLL